MSEAKKKRNSYGPEFKAKVVLEAVLGMKMIDEIAQEHGVHPVLVGQWKKEILEQAGTLFEGKREPKPQDTHESKDRLYGEIGRLKMELDWLKKKARTISVAKRMAWIERGGANALLRQCELTGVARASVYRRTIEREQDEEDLLLCRLIDKEYTRRPYYGRRRMVVYLGRLGHVVNRKRVQGLMRTMGLAGMAPGPNTSNKHPQHKMYPYLLRGVAVERPNTAWSADVTYFHLARGFVYLVAVIDWYSRRALSWRISNSMDASFCVDCLEDALRVHGKPEVFNSDQGSQFTSNAFTGVLQREGIAISMDGRGRALTNTFVERLWRSVKYEDVYLQGYGMMGELTLGLASYFAFYNRERPHQLLGNRTPHVVYASGQGGGTKFVDKFGAAREEFLAPLRCARDFSRVGSGQRCFAASEVLDAA
jgi:putative transposase